MAHAGQGAIRGRLESLARRPLRRELRVQRRGWGAVRKLWKWDFAEENEVLNFE